MVAAFVALVTISLAMPQALSAGQEVAPRSQPSCREARSAVINGSTDSWDISTLIDCGPRGAEALATAFGNARTATDPRFLRSLMSAMANIRHPDIVEVAIDVAGDGGASVPARATALLIVKWQYSRTIIFADGLEILLNGPLKGGCQMAWITPVPDFDFVYPMRRSYRRRMAAAVTDVAADDSAPEHIRQLAACVQEIFRRADS